mgnify:CR=1 FL=1
MELLHEMGLDRPLYVQFFDYVGGVLQGDLGVSIITFGQYLQPSTQHLPVARYVNPEEFSALAEYAREVISIAAQRRSPSIIRLCDKLS